jgi:hypothetical protein
VLTDNEILPSQARVFNHCCSEIFVNIRGGSIEIKNSVETNAGMSFRLFVFSSFRLFVFFQKPGPNQIRINSVSESSNPLLQQAWPEESCKRL